ncbi:unnamed protein product [Adineta steineri]|uniref:Uncharacterized protein n=1 Tax=Adineta steineri TaxID=433720 RepID=A0A820IH71_9BILA|nr:unnamed protein product [Adineta steineri]CAF4181717.1 unnamed protein product [Adineta steineri]CAF4308803.1 unnamed protein product [Adineta steineri]
MDVSQIIELTRNGYNVKRSWFKVKSAEEYIERYKQLQRQEKFISNLILLATAEETYTTLTELYEQSYLVSNV